MSRPAQRRPANTPKPGHVADQRPGGALPGWLVPTVLAAAFFGGMYFVYPYYAVFEFDPDEGILLLTARTLADGARLNADLWSDHPPLGKLLVCGWCLAFGWDVATARVLQLLCGALLLFAIGDSTRMLSNRVGGAIAIGLLAFSAQFLQMSASLMIGLPAVTFAASSLWAFLHWWQRPRTGWLVASAILMSASLLTKVIAAPLIPIVSVAILLRGVKQGEQNAWLRGLRWSALWCLATIALTLLILRLTVPPAFWSDLYLSHTKAAQARTTALGAAVMEMLRDDAPLLLLAVLGLVVATLRHRRAMLVPAVWCAAGIGLLWFHHPVWYHHRLILTAPAAILAGGVASLMGTYRAAISPLVHAARLATVLVAIGVGAWFVSVAYATDRTACPLSKTDPRPYDRYVVELMRAVCPDSGLAVVDRPMHAFRAGLHVPPALCNTSYKRLATGQLTPQAVRHVIRERKPHVVAFSRALHPAAAWIMRTHTTPYELIHAEPGTIQVYLRRDVAPDWYATASHVAVARRYAPAHVFVGLARSEQRDLNGARRQFNAALRLDATDADAWYYAAELEFAAENYAGGFEILSRGLAATKGRANLRLARQYAWRRATCPDAAQRNGEEALAVIEQVIEIEGAAGPLREELIRAAALAACGRFDDAEAVQRQLLRQSETANTPRRRRINEALMRYTEGVAWIEAAEWPRRRDAR